MTPVAPTLAGAQEASRLFAIDQCGLKNRQLKAAYNVGFDAWKLEVESGKRDNLNPPSVPLSWIPFTYPDGFTYEVLGATPVQSPRSDIPVDHSQQAEVIPGELDAINVPPGDSSTVGTIISGVALMDLGANPREIGSPGSSWKKSARGGPFGLWQWYQRL